MVSRVEVLVDNLFDAFQSGDWDRAGKCFAEGGTISTRWGADSALGKTWPEARKDLENLVKAIGLPKYSERQKFCTETSFVEQHITELAPPGAKKPSKLHAALVGRVDPTSGLITSLEEYLDPAPLRLPNQKQRTVQTTASRAANSQAARQPLDGAVVVVSGASSGIGEGIAMECAHRGARLILTARRLEQLQRVADACKDAGALDIAIVEGDTRNEDTAQRIVAAACGFGGVDRLYVNAGISQNTNFMDAPLSTVREQMEVNFFGGVVLTRACLPSLLERKGRIAAVTSVQGRLPAPRNTGYSASKHAMHGFFESLRQELDPKGVKVTMVIPGPVDTNILSNLQGPAGKKVALVLSNAEKKNMTSANEAGRIAVDACEQGIREVAFPKNMASLMQLRAADPEKVDASIRRMYETMETCDVAPTSKL